MRARLRAWALCLGAAPLIAACATDEQKRSAINDVNAEFRVQYEQILTERRTREDIRARVERLIDELDGL